MNNFILRILVIATAFVFGSGTTFAENRVALVIGQSAYRNVTPLPNPANDAKVVAGLLTEAGFEVTAAPDLTQTDLRQAIGDFAAKVATKGPDTVALVFYAGHGVQIDGENYLVPVDVNLARELEVPLQSVRLNDLMNALAAVPSKTRIVMLDACRNNPFGDISRTAGKGLAIVDVRAGSAGTFISYSTSPGMEALDGSGADSPYTTALLTSAKEPGLPIEEAFKRVRVSVNKATGGAQTPWESSSLVGDFYFFRQRPPPRRRSRHLVPRRRSRLISNEPLPSGVLNLRPGQRTLPTRSSSEPTRSKPTKHSLRFIRRHLLLRGCAPCSNAVGK